MRNFCVTLCRPIMSIGIFTSFGWHFAEIHDSFVDFSKRTKLSLLIAMESNQIAFRATRAVGHAMWL